MRKYINLMITFLVSGLWHGAAWNYVIWGGVHGLYQVVGDVLEPLKNKICEALRVNTNCESFKVLKIIVTFVLTDFAWIFFRAPSGRYAIAVIMVDILSLQGYENQFYNLFSLYGC